MLTTLTSTTPSVLTFVVLSVKTVEGFPTSSGLLGFWMTEKLFYLSLSKVLYSQEKELDQLK